MVQRHPQYADKAIVTLYDNIISIDDMIEYEQYTVIVPWKDNLAIDIAKNLTQWILSAKEIDIDVKTLQDTIAELDTALLEITYNSIIEEG